MPRLIARLKGREATKKSSRRQRGVALLLVLVMVALVTSVTEDFQFNSRVDMQLALNARDELQAEYNALSALRLRALLLKHGRTLTTAMQTLAPTLGVDPSMMPPMGQLLEMVPIECGLMSAITKTGDDADKEGGSDFFPGECEATAKSEHSKISLSVLRSISGGEAKRVSDLLMAFLSDPKLERHFQEDDANGSHAESPEELVGAIIDWIDPDKNQTGSSVGDEDRFYAYLKDPYRAKNAPFDSVAELQLVHGVDDELYDILKDQVTIYNNSAQVELSTADDYTIAIGLCGAVQPGSSCDFLLMPALWTALANLRSTGMPLNLQTLSQLIQTANLPIDTGRLSQVFTDRNSSTWYTIEASGQVGKAQRHVRTVFQTREGQFYYFRIE